MSKSNVKNQRSMKTITAVLAALLGLASSFFYQRHIQVEAYITDDVSHVVGLYLAMASTALWAAFLVVYFTTKR